ncbi:MAG: response regulator [Deltaproteobacteria bacterium]|nr:response regulator [Deltaproteobacteria bacterium]
MEQAPEKATLLVVDDEENVRRLLEESLSDAYRVTTAESGAAALEALAAGPVDVLLTDQRMPNMSGIQLVQRAREIDPDLIAILLTAYTDPRDLIDAINLGGIYRFISKPWDLDDLRLTLLNAVEHRRLRAQQTHLRGELERRYAALELFYDVAQQATLARSGLAVIDLVLERLDRAAQFDVAVSVLLDRASADAQGRHSGRIIVRASSAVAQQDVVRLRDQAIERLEKMIGQPLAESRLSTRTLGHPAAAETGQELRSHLFVPLRDEAGPIGILALAAVADRTYGAEHADLLDILANRTVEAVRGIARAAVSERRRLENAVAAMADGVLMTDAEGEVIVANPAASELLGLPAGIDVSADLLKQRLGFYPFDLVRGWAEREQRLQEEVCVAARTLHSIISPVRGVGGQFDGVVVVLRDVTEQRQLEARKEEFISVVTRELHTPITGIGGALDLLLGGYAGELNEKQQHFLRMAKDSTSHLDRIVDDLLDLSRSAPGKLTLERQPISLDQVCHDAVEKFLPSALDRRIALSMTGASDRVAIEADPFRLGQVLANLLSNGLKFAREDGHIEVAVGRAGAVSDLVVISIFNDGPEIEVSDLDLIFEKFAHDRALPRSKVHGTGLGLAICRRIVEAHGGAIWAESGRGEGTRFYVVLPERPLPPGETVAPALPTRPRVVVLMDDRQDAAAVKAVLLAVGAEVLLASTLDQAIAICGERAVELLLIDPTAVRRGAGELADALAQDIATRHVALALLGSGQQPSARSIGLPAASADLRREFDALLRQQLQRPRARVLLCDPDATSRQVCRDLLTQSGYRVVEATDLAGAATAIATASAPLDVVLAEALLPDGNALRLLPQLAREQASDEPPLILFSARASVADRVRALREGVADFLAKPFDSAEFLARVDASLRRRQRSAAGSQGSRLPGADLVEEETRRRLRAGEGLGLCHLDIDDLEAFADCYGFARADGVIAQTGDLIRQLVGEQGHNDDFVGHVGGDRFVLISTPDRVEALARAIVAAFDRVIPLHYTREDRQRGFIEATDRSGQRRRVPIMGLSAAVLLVPGGGATSYGDLMQRVAEAMRRTQDVAGSAVLLERVEARPAATAP